MSGKPVGATHKFTYGSALSACCVFPLSAVSVVPIMEQQLAEPLPQ